MPSLSSWRTLFHLEQCIAGWRQSSAGDSNLHAFAGAWSPKLPWWVNAQLEGAAAMLG